MITQEMKTNSISTCEGEGGEIERGIQKKGRRKEMNLYSNLSINFWLNLFSFL